MQTKHTFSIVEDDIATAKRIQTILESTGRFVLNDIFYEIEHAPQGLEQNPPRIVLLDIAMPDHGTIGSKYIPELKRLLSNEALIVVVSNIEKAKVIFPCLRDGAAGYFIKNDGLNELPTFLELLMDGKTSISLSVANRINEHFRDLPDDLAAKHGLSQREHQVIELISRGFSTVEITRTLTIKRDTVKSHVANVLAKLNATNRAHAVRRFYLHED